MAEVWFYHLTDTPLEATLPALLDRARGAGWRVAVRGADPARLARLDEQLWLGDKAGFLAHGLAGGPHDADQPVLLTTGPERPNGAVCLMAVEGAEVAEAELEGLTRAMVIFDGNDPAAVEAARGQWKRLTATGVKAQYWAEAGGKWQKKAES
jgi:DNA polymerase-3 subunit chi